MSTDDHILYILDIRFPDHPSKRFEILGQFSIGSDENCSFCLEDYSLAPKHCLFRDINGVLSLHQIAPSGSTKIGGQPLNQGRMYILEKGDDIEISDIKIIIRTETQSAKTQEEVIADERTEIKNLFEMGLNQSEKKEASDLILEETVQEKTEEVKNDGYDEQDVLIDKTKSKVSVASTRDKTDKIEIDDLKESSTKENTDKDLNTKNKKKSFFLRFFKKNKPSTQERKKAPNLSKKGVKKSLKAQKVPGFFPRIISILLSLFMAYSLSTLIDNEVSKNLFEDFHNITQNKLQTYININIFKVIVSYISLELISNLLLATTLPLFLMGVKENSSFMTARLKALMRSLLAIITTPLLVFDLPLIIRKRSLKEVLTFSHLKYRNSWMKFFILPLIPVILLICIALPLIKNINYLKGPYPIDRKIKSVKAHKKNKDQYLFTTTIGEMELNFNMLLPKTIIISPEIRSKKDKLIYGLRFINRKTSQHFLFAKKKSVEYTNFTKLLKRNNPSLKYFFPNLNSLNENDNNDSSDEFSKLIRLIFTHQKENIKSALLSLGPFLYGPLEVKREFIRTFRIKKKSKMIFFELEKRGRSYTVLYIKSPKKSELTSDRLLIFLKDKIVEFKITYMSTSRKLAQSFPSLILKGLSPMIKMRKKSSKIGESIKTTFKMFDLLKKDCALIKDEMIGQYKLLINSHQMLIDTTPKDTIKKIFKNSLLLNRKNLDRLELNNCKEREKIIQMINQSAYFQTLPENVEEVEEVEKVEKVTEEAHK